MGSFYHISTGQNQLPNSYIDCHVTSKSEACILNHDYTGPLITPTAELVLLASLTAVDDKGDTVTEVAERDQPKVCVMGQGRADVKLLRLGAMGHCISPSTYWTLSLKTVSRCSLRKAYAAAHIIAIIASTTSQNIQPPRTKIQSCEHSAVMASQN